MTDLPATNTNNKKQFPGNLKFFSLRAKHTKKYLFCLILIIVLTAPIFANKIISYVKADAPASFSFTAGGDIGGNPSSSTTLDLIAQSASNFYLAMGDLSYSEITPEPKWCSYVQSRVGSTFPFELLSGNHEDGGEIQDGLIDNFVQCLPDRLGSQGTYGKEYYFDYPASSPIARFIMVSPGLNFTNGGSYSYATGTDHYNWVSNTIDAARAAGIKWVIVGMHKVCISMGSMPCDIGNDIFNLLVSKKVDLIIQAHDHDYQRSKQLAFNGTTCTAIQAETYNSDCVVNDGSTGVYTQGAGPVDVILGTVGEVLSPINTSDGDAGYFANWMGNNVNATNGLTKFSVSSDQLTVSANFTGSTVPASFSDTFTITSSTATPTPTPTPPPGVISLRASAIGNNGTGNSSLTIGLPAGTTSGDVMVAHIVVRTAGNSITPPTGWSLVLRQDTSSSLSTATYVKVAGSSEPLTYTWSFGTSGEASGGIASYIGVSSTTPVDAAHAQYNSSTSNVDNSGVTTTVANDMLVYAVGIIVQTTVNDPAGFTEVWRTGSKTSTTSEMSQEIDASTGVTGTIHGTHNGGANSNITMLIALEPAGAPTPTPTPTPTSTPTPTPTPTPPPGGISLRAVTTNNNGAGSSSLTIGLPAGTQSGDVMVAHIVVRTAGNSIAAPSGWSIVLRQDTSSSLATATYVKVAGSSEPASYTWNFGTSGEASGGIASYIGVDTTTPVDAAHAQYNNGTSNVDNSGVTTTVANDMLVYAVGIVALTTVNVPSGFTEEWRAHSNSLTTAEMSQEIFASTGATGTIHGTLSASNSNITMLIALRPAGSTPPPPPSGISLRAAAVNNNGAGGSSLTIGLPAGTQSGDVMIAFVTVRNASNTITPPTGWNLVLRQNSSSSLATATYVKVAGSSEPASYTWSFGTSGEASGWIAGYIGVNTTTPVDVAHAQYNSSTSNVDNSGVTTTVANDMLVYAVGIVAATSVNDPAGFTEECYSASNSLTTAEMSQEIFASAAATGTIHGTLGVSNSNITQLIALKPA